MHAERSEPLDALRGVAILLVVQGHYWAASRVQAPALLSLGWSGVDLFFVLSGFLIGGGLIDQRAAGNMFRVFYARRAARILPAYAVLLVVLFAGGFAAPFMGMLTFTQNYWPLVSYPTMVFITWSLAVEEQFYLLLPALVRFTPPSRLLGVAVGLVLAAPLWRALVVQYGGPVAAYTWLPCRMDGLFMGVICAWVMRQEHLVRMLRARRGWVRAALAVGAAGFVVLSVLRVDPDAMIAWTVGYTWLAGFYAVLLLASVTAPPMAGCAAGWLRVLRRPLCWVGIGAYAIYLWHVPVLMVSLVVAPNFTAPVFVAALVVMALVMWFGIERAPIRMARARWRYGGR